MVVELPTFRGGSCQNTRCEGAGPVRVLSVEEAERMYPVKQEYDWWPVPPQATHVCTVCGFAYNGVGDRFKERARWHDNVEEMSLGQWTWEHDKQFDMTVREATKEFIQSAPPDADDDTIAEGVNRYVAGADGGFARDVMMEMDEYDGGGRNLADFM